MLVVVQKGSHDDTLLLNRIIHGRSRSTGIIDNSSLGFHCRKPLSKTLLPLLCQQHHTISSVQRPYKQFIMRMILQLIPHVDMHDNLLSAK